MLAARYKKGRWDFSHCQCGSLKWAVTFTTEANKWHLWWTVMIFFYEVMLFSISPFAIGTFFHNIQTFFLSVTPYSFFSQIQKISGFCCTTIACYSFQYVLQNMYFIITAPNLKASSSAERNWYGLFTGYMKWPSNMTIPSPVHPASNSPKRKHTWFLCQFY